MTTESQHDFTEMIDLAQERLGGKALLASDEFFAEKENLLKPGRGVFLPDEYTDRGKWMDGWESRRKREVTKRNPQATRLRVRVRVRTGAASSAACSSNSSASFSVITPPSSSASTMVTARR